MNPNEIKVVLEKASILDEAFQQIDRTEDLAIIRVIRVERDGVESLEPRISTNVADPDRLNSLLDRLKWSLNAWMYGVGTMSAEDNRVVLRAGAPVVPASAHKALSEPLPTQPALDTGERDVDRGSKGRSRSSS